MNLAALETPRLIDAPTVAAMIGVSPRQIWKLSDRGAMPAPVHIGRLCKWRVSDIEQWISDGCPEQQ